MIFSSEMHSFVYSFSAPLFFFVSGYLLPKQPRDFKETLSKGLKQLIIPFLFVALFELVLITLHNIGYYNIYDHLLTPIIRTAMGYSIPLINAMWFVIAVPILELVYCTISFQHHVGFSILSL